MFMPKLISSAVAPRKRAASSRARSMISVAARLDGYEKP